MWPQYYSTTVTNLIQRALIQLCSEYIPYENKLYIDGIICISSGDDSKQIVVKVHESLAHPDGWPTTEDKDSKDTKNSGQEASIGTEALCEETCDSKSPVFDGSLEYDPVQLDCEDRLNKRKSKAIKLSPSSKEEQLFEDDLNSGGTRDSLIDSFKAPMIPSSRDNRPAVKKRKLSDIFGAPSHGGLDQRLSDNVSHESDTAICHGGFSCKLCFGRFSSFNDLQSHNMELHAKQTCQECFQLFPHEIDLIHHMKTHAPFAADQTEDVSRSRPDAEEWEEPVFNGVQNTSSVASQKRVATSSLAERNMPPDDSLSSPYPRRGWPSHCARSSDDVEHKDSLVFGVEAQEKVNMPIDLSCRSEAASVHTLNTSWEADTVGESDEPLTTTKIDENPPKADRYQMDLAACYSHRPVEKCASSSPFHALNIKKKITSFNKRSRRSPTFLANPHIDTENKDYPCSYCRTVWSGFKSFDNHTIQVHQRYPCAYCKNTFTNKNNRNRHIRAHMGQNRYECDQCGKVFTRTDSLKEHRFVHTASYQANKCWTCGTELQTKTEILAHLKKCGSRLRPRDEPAILPSAEPPRRDINGLGGDNSVHPEESSDLPNLIKPMVVKMENNNNNNNNEESVSYSSAFVNQDAK